MDPNTTSLPCYNELSSDSCYGEDSSTFPTTTVATPVKHVIPAISVAFKVVYVVGILGNLGAIIILRIGERRVRNRKHLLLLTTLAANDLIALVGMLSAMIVSERSQKTTQLYCGARVVIRVFGIGSVCIAVTMALERYLALTRPFLYHKQVTYYVIRTTLLVSWFWAALLTCAPIMGLGAYWDKAKGECIRYKNATEGIDYGYAVVYVAFGTLLCVILVYCNVAVIRALYAISSPRAGAPAVRRVSRRSCPRAQPAAEQPVAACGAATAEEVAFSRLMATLSVLFMMCWLPQMVTSALYLALGPPAWPRLALPTLLSDLLMLLNYVLDPVLYVLVRRTRFAPLHGLWRALASCCKRRRHKSSTGSTKTCCLQDTVMTSESSAAELRPLQSRIIVTPSVPPVMEATTEAPNHEVF